MADDYDKEATVMENENIGDNLPEFSVVVIKKEVVNFYDSDFESTTSSVQDRKPILQQEIITSAFETLSSDTTDTGSFQSNILNCNKIILGSKPNVVYNEEDFNENSNLYQENDVSLANNTKLNPKIIEENFFEELVTSYEPKLELHDIQSYLHKSRRFCKTCGILFPELNNFETHVRIFHTEASLAVISHQKSDLAKRRIYKCTICEKKFVAPHVLRKHLSTIHRLRNGNETKTNKHRYKRVLDNTMRQHRCPICGLKFISPRVLKNHLINFHKLNYLRVPNQQNCQSTTNTVNDNNCRNVNHDKTSGWSNTCFHCKKPFDTQKSLIEHLYDILQMKRKNTEIVPVFKSILFKCNKCDIHFTSSQFAANHAEHMEMLINWKCTICNRIFKNEDALSHERQHSVTNNFLVYNLEDLDVTQILCKCSKCGIHFTESNYLYHFRDCGLEYSKFINCKICDMSLDYNLKPLHESNKHTVRNSYTIIESDVISDNPVKSTAKKYQAKEKLKELIESFHEVKVVLQKIDSCKQNKLNQLITETWSSECLSDLESSSYEEISNKAPELQERNNTIRQSKGKDFSKRRNLTYFFCETCKCFVTRHKKNTHLEARCKFFSKGACKHCGLMFTTASLMTHEQLHKEKKDLSLNNFEFFNLYNGQPINPTKTEDKNIIRTNKISKHQGRRKLTYLYCETCKCCVTNFYRAKYLHQRKLCKTLSKTSCKYCSLMFTSASIMKHRRLHEERKDLTLTTFKFFNLHSGKRMKAPVPKRISINQSMNNEAESENGIDVDTQSINENEIGAEYENILDNNEADDLHSQQPINIEAVDENSSENIEGEAVNETQTLHIRPNNKKLLCFANMDNWHTRRHLTYFYCETCKCFITNFRTDIHLRGRCKKLAKKSCAYCGLTFTNGSMVTHLRLHYDKTDLSMQDFKFFNLYNGQPMNPPIQKVTNKRPANIKHGIVTTKRPIDIDAEVECSLQTINNDAESENGIDIDAQLINENEIGAEYENLLDNNEADDLHSRQPINIEAVVGNENSSENIEGEAVNETPTLHIRPNNKNIYYYCETCKCFITNFRPDIHLRGRCKKLAKKSCAYCGLTFTNGSMVKHLRLHYDKTDLSMQDFKFFNLYNGQPMNPPIQKITNKRPANIKHGIVTTKRPIDIDAEVECSLQTINNDAESENGIDIDAQLINENEIGAEYENLLDNNEADDLHSRQPINIEAVVGNENSSENIEGEAVNETPTLHIRPNNKNIYYYCETCKCFITKFRPDIHLRGRCKKLAKKSCAYCGLTFTGSMATHLRLHYDKTDLSMQDFKFFNLYNGQPMNPPIQKVTNKRPVNIKHGIVTTKQPIDIDAEVECSLRNINNDAESENGVDIDTQLINENEIGAEYEKLLDNNEAEDLHSQQPINIEAVVGNGNSSENIEGEAVNETPTLHIRPNNKKLLVLNESLHLERPINIDNLVGNDNCQENTTEEAVVTRLLHFEAETNKVFANKEAESLRVGRPINIVAEVVNEKRLENIEGKSARVTPVLHIEAAENKFANNKAESLIWEQPINIEANVAIKNHLVNIQGESVNVTPLLHNEAESVLLERPINLEAQVVHENYLKNVEGISVNVNPLLNIEAENTTLFANHEAESLSRERPINIEAKVANKNCLENIQGESVNVTPLLHNEAESLRLERPINIEAQVVQKNCLENVEGISVNVTPLLNIEAKNKKRFENEEAEVGGITQLANNKAEAENVLQPFNIESEIGSIIGAVNNEVKVFTINAPTYIEAEIENIKQLVNNETNILYNLGDENNEAQVLMSINSEVESGVIKLRLNSESHSNNKAEDESSIRPIDHNTGIGHIIQPLNSTVKNENKIPYVLRSKLNIVYHYCECCKCFITPFKKKIHLKARCGNLPKITCIHCGLMFTSGSMVTHERLHIEHKKLTVNHFMFFNLYSGQPMNPPIPAIDNTEETVNSETELVKINQSEMINKRTVNPKDKVVYTTQPSNNEPKVPYLKMSGNTNDWRRKLSLTLYFCETCKCFITKYKKSAHLKARCNMLAKMDCKRCGLTFTSGSMMTHNRLHEEWKDLTVNNFTFFNLNGEPINPPLPEVLHKKEPVSVETEGVHIKQPTCKEAKVPRRNLTYYFCDTCKCFITKYNKKDAHLQAHCKKFSKSNCKRCGLKFTQASMKTHKRLHRENKDLSLKNFKLFNLYNGQPMKVPTYKAVNRKRLKAEEGNITNYYCKTCKCFVISPNQTAHIRANCKNVTKIPCKHCGLIFHDTSFPLHKRLHEEIKDLTLNNLKFFDLCNVPINPPIPEYPKCANCAVHFLTVTAKNSHICSEVSSLSCHVCEIKLSEAAFKLHMAFHQYAINNTNTITLDRLDPATNMDQNVETNVSENIVTKTSNRKSDETDLHNSPNGTEARLQRSADMNSVVYCCLNCSTSVDTYDKAVEHSQKHYETDEHVTQAILCNSCNLKIDEACYMEHQNLHESKTLFKFLHFDSYYLPAENNLWIKHIFKTLPNEEVLDILRNSIYRFECRIKMNVIQKGDPNFTMYKCDQCNCFIEPSSLFKHPDNACFKLRNHPCTVCGIAFNSSASRIDHEKIHNQPGLTTESYRIVVFNRERDLQINRSLCLHKKYVLYKCRNCDAIVDKPRENNHICDFSNVKNCPYCALLLNMKDYEIHLNTHEQFISFSHKNMKVVLIGETNTLEMRSENNLRSKFKGAIYDYKMFVCNKCEICIKNKEFMPKHICRFGKQRLKCSKCDLYLSVGRLKTHMRCHEQDTDFIRSNMYIISFDPCTVDQNKNATKLFTEDKNCEPSDSNTDSDLECLSANDIGTRDDTETADVTTETVEEETAKIYKCSCELHFLNEDSIFRHFGTCRSDSKITKLKCHECDLLFSPNVLFTHLLAHHNNKGRRYKYDIIQIDHFK